VSSGRPLVVDDDQIKSLIESNPHYTTRKIAELKNRRITKDYLHTLGYIYRYDI